MSEAKQSVKRLLLILFLLIEIAVIAISICLISTIDNKDIPEYTVIEEIPCDELLQQQEEIAFVSNGETQIYQMPVSLLRGEAFDISFSVDCDDTDGGLFFVDLCGGMLYDSPDTEFRRTALEGQYTIADRIHYSGARPLQCNIRFFTQGDVSAKITDVTVSRVQKEMNMRDVAVISILVINAAMIVFLAGLLMRHHIDRAQQLTEKQKKGISCIALGLIICMQVLLIAFWMEQKSNYYVDELYSMEKAQSFAYNSKYTKHLYDCEKWEENTWMNASEWQKNMTLSGNESVFCQSPITTMRSMLKERNYNGLLNIMESFIFPGEISKYPGIVLNMVFFVLMQIVLYRFLFHLGISRAMALLGVFWYGFCGMIVDTAEYTRFYMVTMFLLLLVMDLHLIMWKTEDIRKVLLCEMIALFCTYLGCCNSELMAILFAFLMISFTVGLLVRRRFKSAFCYATPILGISLVYLIVKTPFMDMLQHYSEYVNRAQIDQGAGDIGRVDEVLLQIHNLTFTSVMKKALLALNVLIEGVFGSWMILLAFAFVMLIIFIYNRKKKNALKIANRFAIVIPSIAIGFFLIMICSFAVVPRYYSFLTVLIVSFSVCLLDADIVHLKKANCYGLLLAVITFGILNTHFAGNIKYVYTDDRAFLQEMENYRDTDVIVDQSYDSFQRALYECVIYSGDKRSIFPTSDQRGQLNIGDNRKQVLLWVFPGNDISNYEQELTSSGYKWHYLGKSEAAEVYIFQK